MIRKMVFQQVQLTKAPQITKGSNHWHVCLNKIALGNTHAHTFTNCSAAGTNLDLMLHHDRIDAQMSTHRASSNLDS